ncbi:MAG: threonine/serine exporter family protein [Clostridia bacterium]|nr:threonine/serine exporter family protein [Clostridia bacterium]
MENNLSQREILDIATSMGYHILKNGGEINRAEDTARRIGLAYGIDYIHVFAIASSVVITTEKDGVSLTQTRRVKSVVTNLDRIDKFNNLSRRICNEKLSYAQVIEEIKNIEGRHQYSPWVLRLAYALIGGSFAVFFGGAAIEFLVGFLVGFCVKLVIDLFNHFQAPPFFVNVAGAATTVILVKILSEFFGNFNTEQAITGVLMNLVPGVLLTNCIRDFIATDYSAGTAKIIEAFFTAAAIALGVAVSVIWR